MTAEKLRETLSYDREAGRFTWRINRGKAKVGAEAGYFNGGYRYINIRWGSFPAHRLAWLYVHGRWPEGEIDHKNLNRSDNRFDNLREATGTQNMANRKGWSSTGYKGVWTVKNRFVASIDCCGQRYYIGCFETAEEAGAAYLKAAEQLFGEFARAA